MHDNLGEMLGDMCWFAPVTLSDCEEDVLLFSNLFELKEFSDQFVLMMPKIEQPPGAGALSVFSGSYHGVGHLWTERQPNGFFSSPKISKDIFKDWEMPGAALIHASSGAVEPGQAEVANI